MNSFFKTRVFAYTLAIALGLATAGAVAAWSGPGGRSPGDNSGIGAFLDTSGTLQTKAGDLWTSGSFTGNNVTANQYCIGVSCISSWAGAGSQWAGTSPGAIYYNGGNVGIGTSAALPALFGVQGGANNSGTTFFINNRTRNDSQLAVLVQAGTAGGDFGITTSGNVGVGTVSPGPSTKLQVAGRGLFTGGIGDPGDGSPAGVSISYDGTYGNIDAIQTGVAGKPLRLNAAGGGTVSTGGALTVTGSLSAASATVGGSTVCTAANGACTTGAPAWASITGKPYSFNQSTDSGASPTFGAITVSGINDSAGTRIDAGGGWVRTYGNTGWYNGYWGGGMTMTQAGVVSTYGGTSLNVQNNLTVAANATIAGSLSAASATVGGSTVCTAANGACTTGAPAWASITGKPYSFNQSTDSGASPTFATVHVTDVCTSGGKCLSASMSSSVGVGTFGGMFTRYSNGACQNGGGNPYASDSCNCPAYAPYLKKLGNFVPTPSGPNLQEVYYCASNN